MKSIERLGIPTDQTSEELVRAEGEFKKKEERKGL